MSKSFRCTLTLRNTVLMGTWVEGFVVAASVFISDNKMPGLHAGGLGDEYKNRCWFVSISGVVPITPIKRNE